MAIGSNVNPNYPIPGLDQSSKGFRDNFATIKKELESLQKTGIQLTGAVVSDVYTVGSSQIMAINTNLDIVQIPLPSPLNSIQYNKNGQLTGNIKLVFDSGNISVGVGTSLPNSSYGIDCVLPVRAQGNIVVNQPKPNLGANLIISTANTTVMFSNYDDRVEIGSESNIALDIITNSESRIFVDYNGNVGINSRDPLATLHVLSYQPQLANFYTPVSNVSNMFRVSTGGINSTIGIGLENLLGNTLGGIRINQLGTLSLHTGEQSASYLSQQTAKFVITKNGDIGIGNFNPTARLEVVGTFKSQGINDKSTSIKTAVGINEHNPIFALDVNGDIATANAFVSSADSVIIDNQWLTIDAIPTTTFRSARYTVQVSNDALSEVNLIECLLTHIQGNPYLQIINQYQFPPPGSNLGSLQAIQDLVNQEYVLLQYQGINAGNRVRASKIYILN